MYWWISNKRSKQTNPVYLQFLLNYALFSQKLVLKVVKKKNLEYENISNSSTELSVDMTSEEFQSQTILFSRKIKSSI